MLTRRESISMFACVEEDRVSRVQDRTSSSGILAFLLRHARLQQALFELV